MKIDYLKNNPREIQLEEDLPPYMTEGVANDIAEIFNTPLSGAYNWDYTVQDNRIKKLYELGKELNWNVEVDVDWSRPFEPLTEPTPIFWDDYPPYQKFSDDKIKVFCGPSSVYGFDAIKNGTIGTMDCFANVWLPGAIDLFYESLTNHENAQLLQDKGKLLTKLFTSQGRTLYPSTKAAMNILGYNGGYVREPLLDLDQDNVKTIEFGLKELMI